MNYFKEYNPFFMNMKGLLAILFTFVYFNYFEFDLVQYIFSRFHRLGGD